MDEEIYLVNHNPASVENFRTVPRGLCVSDYDPNKDLRNLRAVNNSYRHVPPEGGSHVTSHMPIPVYGYQATADDFLMSGLNVLEALKLLTPQTPSVSASQAS